MCNKNKIYQLHYHNAETNALMEIRIEYYVWLYLYILSTIYWVANSIIVRFCDDWRMMYLNFFFHLFSIFFFKLTALITAKDWPNDSFMRQSAVWTNIETLSKCWNTLSEWKTNKTEKITVAFQIYTELWLSLTCLIEPKVTYSSLGTSSGLEYFFYR